VAEEGPHTLHIDCSGGWRLTSTSVWDFWVARRHTTTKVVHTSNEFFIKKIKKSWNNHSKKRRNELTRRKERWKGSSRS